MKLQAAGGRLQGGRWEGGEGGREGVQQQIGGGYVRGGTSAEEGGRSEAQPLAALVDAAAGEHDGLNVLLSPPPPSTLTPLLPWSMQLPVSMMASRSNSAATT